MRKLDARATALGRNADLDELFGLRREPDQAGEVISPASFSTCRCCDTAGRLLSCLRTITSVPSQRTPFIFDTTAAKRLLALAETLLSKGGTTERGSTYLALFAVLYGLVDAISRIDPAE